MPQDDTIELNEDSTVLVEMQGLMKTANNREIRSHKRNLNRQWSIFQSDNPSAAAPFLGEELPCSQEILPVLQYFKSFFSDDFLDIIVQKLTVILLKRISTNL